jgi:hypothetical protein
MATDKSKAKGIESNIISEFSGWDDIGDFCIQFYDAKLIVDIGDFKIGDVIPNIVFYFSKNKLEIYNINGELVISKELFLSIK